MRKVRYAYLVNHVADNDISIHMQKNFACKVQLNAEMHHKVCSSKAREIRVFAAVITKAQSPLNNGVWRRNRIYFHSLLTLSITANDKFVY